MEQLFEYLVTFTPPGPVVKNFKSNATYHEECAFHAAQRKFTTVVVCEDESPAKNYCEWCEGGLTDAA